MNKIHLLKTNTNKFSLFKVNIVDKKMFKNIYE